MRRCSWSYIMVSLNFNLSHPFETLLVWYPILLRVISHVMQSISYQSIISILLPNLAHFLLGNLFLLSIGVLRHSKDIIGKCLGDIHCIFSCDSTMHTSFIFYRRHFVTILVRAPTQLILDLVMTHIVSLCTCCP